MTAEGEGEEESTPSPSNPTSYQLRLAGVPIETIAKHLGMSEEDARLEIESVLSDRARELTSAPTTLELERLDTLLSRQWAGAVKGDAKSVNAVMAIEARRGQIIRDEVAAIDDTKKKAPSAELNSSVRGLYAKVKGEVVGDDEQG